MKNYSKKQKRTSSSPPHQNLVMRDSQARAEIKKSKTSFYWSLFKFLYFYIFIILLTSSSAFAAESCYIQLKIQETLLPQGDIQFSLLELSNLYGNYEGFVDYFPSDYVLKNYDNQGNLLNSYSLSSSRYIYWDDFTPGTENPGGVNEVDSGVISAVIPYDAKINKIKVEDNNKVETDLNINPATIKCEKTCKDENQIITLLKEECCSGLIPARQPDSSYICVNCGNNVCFQYEDNYSCPEDCESATTLYVDLKLSLDSANWSDSLTGTAPFNNVSLKSMVTGTVRGIINYKFDCNNDGSWDKTFDNIFNNPKTAENICSYQNPGTYTVKVRAERGSVSAENTATIVVNPLSSYFFPRLFSFPALLLLLVSLILLMLILFVLSFQRLRRRRLKENRENPEINGKDN